MKTRRLGEHSLCGDTGETHEAEEHNDKSGKLGRNTGVRQGFQNKTGSDEPAN